MATNSRIEWTESTWNPVTGCSKISPGCKNCYAERMARRLRAMGQPNYKNGFRVTIHPHIKTLPIHWKKSQRIFVNSMSDLFHTDIPTSFILDLLGVMRQANWHTYQILTKRSENLVKIDKDISWEENIWMGVTVEDGDHAYRIQHLRECSARHRFVSFEPLIGPVGNLNLKKIDWVIVGGESGPRSRPIRQDWVIEIMEQCRTARIPFFFKQWGGFNKKKNGRTLLGKIYDEIPSAFSTVRN